MYELTGVKVAFPGKRQLSSLLVSAAGGACENQACETKIVVSDFASRVLEKTNIGFSES